MGGIPVVHFAIACNFLRPMCPIRWCHSSVAIMDVLGMLLTELGVFFVTGCSLGWLFRLLLAGGSGLRCVPFLPSSTNVSTFVFLVNIIQNAL